MTTNEFSDYELLDFGNGDRLERFANNKVCRPEKSVSSDPAPDDSIEVDAICHYMGKNRYEWDKNPSFSEDWRIDIGSYSGHGIKLLLRTSQSMNIGVFPEQHANWQWLSKVIEGASRPLNILNLFGYTGAASLVMAASGAKVCHVDASKSAVSWAKENQALSNLSDKPIRWIVDDAIKFIHREARRGNKYDGIVLDPPAFGRSRGGTFQFGEHIHELLQGCKVILSDEPEFLLLNCYATGLEAREAKHLLEEYFPDEEVDSGTLSVKSNLNNKSLNCSVFARI